VNRRGFVQDTALLAASLAAWQAYQVRGDLRVASAFDAIALALVDRDLPGSEAFAAAARANGVVTIELTRDLASVWMSELEPRLRAGPVAIAGYTNAATLFCLDLLARDFGARTVRRADAGAAVSFVISQSPGRRAPLAPAAVRAQWRSSHA
jgi:hypothetical protein